MDCIYIHSTWSMEWTWDPEEIQEYEASLKVKPQVNSELSWQEKIWGLNSDDEMILDWCEVLKVTNQRSPHWAKSGEISCKDSIILDFGSVSINSDICTDIY